MTKFWPQKGFRGGLGAFEAPRGPRKSSKRAHRELLGASWALQEPKKSCLEGPRIVLEVQVRSVLRKRGSQEGPKRAPKGVQNGSWMVRAEM